MDMVNIVLLITSPGNVSRFQGFPSLAFNFVIPCLFYFSSVLSNYHRYLVALLTRLLITSSRLLNAKFQYSSSMLLGLSPLDSTFSRNRDLSNFQNYAVYLNWKTSLTD